MPSALVVRVMKRYFLALRQSVVDTSSSVIPLSRSWRISAMSQARKMPIARLFQVNSVVLLFSDMAFPFKH
jgi:hypothetical protein